MARQPSYVTKKDFEGYKKEVGKILKEIFKCVKDFQKEISLIQKGKTK